MGTPQYIISHLMLEEHRHNVERNMPNPDLLGPVPARRTMRLAGLRKRASEALFAMAHRLEPASDRTRSGNRGTWISEPMR